MRYYLYCIALLMLLKISDTQACGCGGHDHFEHLILEEEKSFPKMSGHLHIMTHLDNVKQSDVKKRYNELYTHSHLEWALGFDESLSIQTKITLEGHPAYHHSDCGHKHDDVNGQNLYFKNHPIQMEELKLLFEKSNFSIYAGKFNPIVGFDYHAFSGMYTYQEIESYAIRERIGLGGAIHYDHNNTYRTKIDASVFSSDTSILSESILYNRGRNHKYYGGVGNTKDLSSFSVAISSSQMNDEGLYYRIGFAKQAKSFAEKYDELRFSKSFGYNQKISDSTRVVLSGEQMSILHRYGQACNNVTYNTLSSGVNYKQWGFGVGYTYKHTQSKTKGKSFNFSAGYKFNNDIKFELGYKHDKKYQKLCDRFGLLLSYTHEL
jgi:hypothetical protein